MMVSDALAQAAGGGGAASDPRLSMLFQMLQFLPIFVILYLLLIRPQQQQKKKQEQMIRALKKGDRVLTTGGMYGTVLGIDESKVVLRIAEGQKEDVKAEFVKSSILQVLAENPS